MFAVIINFQFRILEKNQKKDSEFWKNPGIKQKKDKQSILMDKIMKYNRSQDLKPVNMGIVKYISKVLIKKQVRK